MTALEQAGLPEREAREVASLCTVLVVKRNCVC